MDEFSSIARTTKNADFFLFFIFSKNNVYKVRFTEKSGKGGSEGFWFSIFSVAVNTV